MNWRRILSWLAGSAWIATWTLVLYLVHSPWRELGGLVSERLRWLERLVLFSFPVIGVTAGVLGRGKETCSTPSGFARRLRVLLYPAAALTAAGLIALEVTDRRDPVGILFTGFLAYWAGLDVVLGAVPLMEGRFLDGGPDVVDGVTRAGGRRRE